MIKNIIFSVCMISMLALNVDMYLRLIKIEEKQIQNEKFTNLNLAITVLSADIIYKSYLQHNPPFEEDSDELKKMIEARQNILDVIEK